MPSAKRSSKSSGASCASAARRGRCESHRKRSAAAPAFHRSEISFLERGLREPALLTILGLAYALNTTPEKLLKDLPLQPTPPRKSTARKQRGGRKKS